MKENSTYMKMGKVFPKIGVHSNSDLLSTSALRDGNRPNNGQNGVSSFDKGYCLYLCK